MELLSSFLMSAVLLFVDNPADPIFQGRRAVRNLDCTRMPQAQAHALYPGRVPEPAPRTQTLTDIDALVCKRRIIAYDERPARDELILTTLRQTTAALTQAAVALGKRETLWYVDAFYPDARISSRIAVAARTELVERGARVSNKVPVLAAGDLLVLRDLRVPDAFPLACTRYAAEQLLNDHEALLAITLVDDRESQLHAGVCLDGQWQWLR